MKIIVIEGIDGSGKTTLINGLKEILKNVQYIKEPSVDSDLEQKLANYILLAEKPEALQLHAFLVNRGILLEKLFKDDNHLYISDRSFLSNLAYQGSMGKIGIKKVFELNKELYSSFGNKGKQLFSNTFHIFLDVDPKITIKRKNAENFYDKKSLNYQKKLRSAYLTSLKQLPKSKIFVVNAHNEKEKVLSDVISQLKKWKII